jgi:YjjG family noncanonical pyrimidine nucleotidase
MYKYILLDADNTLFDFDKAESLSLKATFEHLGIKYTEAINATYSAINLNLWKLFEKNLIAKETIKTQRFLELFGLLGVDADAFIASEVYRKNLETKSILLPHAEKVCEILSAHFVLAIITNGIATTQRNRFKISPISKYINHLIISEDLGTAKPNIEFFDAAFRIIGCSAKEKILVVGDSLSSDILGANNAGVDCCWFNPGGLNNEYGYDIKYEIADLRELPKIVLPAQSLYTESADC